MESKKNSTHDREMIISRTLNAPVELVWEALTNPEHVANWWGPDGFTNTIRTMELRPAGQWNLVMHGPDGTNYENLSVFREVIPLRKIVYEHANPNFTATITFEDFGEQTLLTWQMVFDSAEEFIAVVKTHNADKGFRENVAKLEVYLKNMNVRKS